MRRFPRLFWSLIFPELPVPLKILSPKCTGEVAAGGGVTVGGSLEDHCEWLFVGVLQDRRE